MAGREWRAHPGALTAAALGVALGVACLIATDTLGVSLATRIRAEGRVLLGGDLELRSVRPLSGEVASAISRTGAAARAETVETLSMVTASDGQRTRLVTLKAVSPSYPLYGAMATSPPEAWREFADSGGCLIGEPLALALGLGAGDRLAVGRSNLAVRGILASEPDHLAEAFQLGPRLMIRLAELPATGLIAKGSRATWRTLLAFPNGADIAGHAAALVAAAGDDADVNRADGGSEGMRRILARVTLFLDLAGLTVLLLSGIGTAMAMRTHVTHRIDSLAVLACLGMTGRGLVGLMAVQAGLLALAGCAAGSILGAGLARALPGFLAGVVPLTLELGFQPSVHLRAWLVGTLVACGFALLPLLPLRRLPVATVFRRHVEPAGMFRAGGRTDWASVGAAGMLVAGCLLLAGSRAGSRDLAVPFLGGFAGVLVCLALAARALLAVARRVRLPLGFLARQTIANLHRPGNQSATVVVAVGLSVFLVCSVRELSGTLLEELALGRSDSAPNLFIIDIQPDQRDGVAALLERRGRPADELVPLVRSRLTHLKGEPVHSLFPESGKRPWWVTRDYWLSYRAGLAVTEEVLEGKLWEGTREPEVSVEERTAARFGVGVGDTVSLDVQGVAIEARVTSLRRVRWTSMRPNFFLLFPPGVLEAAPRTYFAVTRVADPAERSTLTRDLVGLHPNLTIIDLAAASQSAKQVLERVGWAVWLVAAFAAAGGALLLGASIALTRRHRLHELALLSLLGAPRRSLVRLVAGEYALLGALAGAVGSVGAVLVSRVIAERLFEMSLPIEAGPVVVSALLAAAFVTLCGAVASAGLLRSSPAEILRSE